MQPVSWASLALAAVSGAGVLAYFNHQRDERKKEGKAALGLCSCGFAHVPLLTANSEVQSVGKALLGGPWELVDADGKPITDADFK